MAFAKTLTRDEMKNIMAGNMQEPCQIFINGHWSGCNFSANEAQSWFNSDHGNITGYCCASCGSGNFSNASSCQ